MDLQPVQGDPPLGYAPAEPVMLNNKNWVDG